LEELGIVLLFIFKDSQRVALRIGNEEILKSWNLD
jgi:hypothetical protein